MPYKLLLTKEERSAFDWVGDRYSTGDHVSTVLCACMTDDKEWDDPGDILFLVPEYIAWEIKACSEEENDFWPCFNDTLKGKMITFCDGIV